MPYKNILQKKGISYKGLNCFLLMSFTCLKYF